MKRPHMLPTSSFKVLASLMTTINNSCAHIQSPNTFNIFKTSFNGTYQLLYPSTGRPCAVAYVQYNDTVLPQRLSTTSCLQPKSFTGGNSNQQMLANCVEILKILFTCSDALTQTDASGENNSLQPP